MACDGGVWLVQNDVVAIPTEFEICDIAPLSRSGEVKREEAVTVTVSWLKQRRNGERSVVQRKTCFLE